jgi:hypothetical protein
MRFTRLEAQLRVATRSQISSLNKHPKGGSGITNTSTSLFFPFFLLPPVIVTKMRNEEYTLDTTRVTGCNFRYSPFLDCHVQETALWA